MTDTNNRLNPSKLARSYGVSRQAVYKWINEGCPREADGSFDLERVNAWHKARQSDHIMDNRAVQTRALLQSKRLMLQCEFIEIQLNKERGRLVKLSDVVTDLKSIRETEKQVLLNLPSRIAAPFGELATQIEQHSRELIMDLLSRLHQGKFYEPSPQQN